MRASRWMLPFVLAGIVLITIVLWISSIPPERATPHAPSGKPPRVSPEARVSRRPALRDRSVVSIPEIPRGAPRVVRLIGPDGKPVPGAGVVASIERPEAERLRQPYREIAAWPGAVSIADEHGEVRFEQDDAGGWTVYARHGVLLGASHISRKDADRVRVIRLSPDLTIRVRVVDPNGQPVAGGRVAFGGERGVDSFAMVAFCRKLSALPERRAHEDLLGGQRAAGSFAGVLG